MISCWDFVRSNNPKGLMVLECGQLNSNMWGLLETLCSAEPGLAWCQLTADGVVNADRADTSTPCLAGGAKAEDTAETVAGAGRMLSSLPVFPAETKRRVQ